MGGVNKGVLYVVLLMALYRGTATFWRVTMSQ